MPGVTEQGQGPSQTWNPVPGRRPAGLFLHGGLVLGTDWVSCGVTGRKGLSASRVSLWQPLISPWGPSRLLQALCVREASRGALGLAGTPGGGSAPARRKRSRNLRGGSYRQGLTSWPEGRTSRRPVPAVPRPGVPQAGGGLSAAAQCRSLPSRCPGPLGPPFPPLPVGRAQCQSPRVPPFPLPLPKQLPLFPQPLLNRRTRDAPQQLPGRESCLRSRRPRRSQAGGPWGAGERRASSRGRRAAVGRVGGRRGP